MRTKQRRFAFDDYLRAEYRQDIAPDAPVCNYYGFMACPKGRRCRDQHIVPSKNHRIVCRHWLRGLCKLGDQCDYIHELDMSRVIECPSVAAGNKCPNGVECLFLHPSNKSLGSASGLVVGDGIIDRESFEKLKDQKSCPAYDKGFCKLGRRCPKPHIRRRMCMRYLAGFCPYGPECSDAHPKFVQIDDSMRITRTQQALPEYMLQRMRAAGLAEPGAPGNTANQAGNPSGGEGAAVNQTAGTVGTA